MRLHSWLLVILGFVVLVAASLPLWPRGLGLHPPSGGEAVGLAALGVGCLLAASYFVRKDRRDQSRLADAARASVLTDELDASGVIADFGESTWTSYLDLEATPDNDSDPFTSKLGGTFYSPPGFAWPLTNQHQPMWPLAQLNFAELPHLDGFPDRGILQFFIAGDDMYGIDFDDLTSQTGFRVVYHAQIETLTFPNPVQPDPGRLNVPFEGVFRISGSAGTMPMTVSDWRFERAVADSWRRCTGSPGEPGPDVVQAARQLLWDADEGDDSTFGGHQVGGYPSFTQDDPRGTSERWQGHTTVLLQIDSSDGICWGDGGIASFLIEPGRLSRCDFSNVVYTWDCH